MTPTRILKLAGLVFTTAWLAACGGGSDSDAGSTTPYAANAAWGNLMSASHAWTVSGSATSQGQSLSIQAQLQLDLLPDAVFDGTGETGKPRRLTTTAAVNGGSPSASSVLYYLNASNAFIGMKYDDGSCTLASNAGVPPTSAVIGSSGPLATWTEYNGCDATATQTATGKATWSITKLDGKVYFCIDSNYTGSDYTSTENDCYQIDTAGTIGSSANVRATSTQSGVSTTVSLKS